MKKYHCVVIGASAGGISTIRTILERVADSFDMPILMVQHIHANFAGDFSKAFRSATHLTVKEADDKEMIKPGVIYLAPPGYHLLVESDFSLSLSVEEQVNFSRPSIDLLFDSAAEVFQEQLIGIVLTGANHDGAKGLLNIKNFDGLTIVEDPKTAHTPTMPTAALKACDPAFVLSAEKIGDLLVVLDTQKCEVSSD